MPCEWHYHRGGLMRLCNCSLPFRPASLDAANIQTTARQTPFPASMLGTNHAQHKHDHHKQRDPLTEPPTAAAPPTQPLSTARGVCSSRSTATYHPQRTSSVAAAGLGACQTGSKLLIGDCTCRIVKLRGQEPHTPPHQAAVRVVNQNRPAAIACLRRRCC